MVDFFLFFRKPKDEPKEESHPTLKVEMQTVRLNPDSQKLVLDTLRFIHGPDFKLGSASLYKVSMSLLDYIFIEHVLVF